MFSRLWSKLRGALGQGKDQHFRPEGPLLPATRLHALIEELVEGTDPRIRALSHYQRALAPAVEKVFDFLTGVVADMPPAIAVDRRSWASDPLVRALFSGVSDLQKVFSKSRDLQEFFARHANPSIDHCYVQIGMSMREKTVLGMQLQGERVRKDVRQTQVNFHDFRVLLPCLTEEALREALVMRGFRILVSYSLEQITERQNQILLLEQQRHTVNARLRAARARADGLEAFLADDGQKRRDITTLEQELTRIQQALQDARKGFDTLEDRVDCIKDVLSQPEAHVRITPRTLYLSRMNVKLDSAHAEGAQEIRITEVSLGDDIKRLVVLARFPHDLLLERGHFLREAERYYS